ncbi:MAG: DUF3253 domain-containing protein [Alphaproteobacteria bacterium]|nr:DUF3253 domain-containing protein [Alphaproteobacteria bacterium]
MTQDREDTEKTEDPIIGYIMAAIERGAPVSPRDVAIAIADDRAKENSPKDAWRKYLLAVKQQAKHLARAGRISILRRGVAIDPDKMKGLIKLSLPVMADSGADSGANSGADPATNSAANSGAESGE